MRFFVELKKTLFMPNVIAVMAILCLLTFFDSSRALQRKKYYSPRYNLEMHKAIEEKLPLDQEHYQEFEKYLETHKRDFIHLEGQEKDRYYLAYTYNVLYEYRDDLLNESSLIESDPSLSEPQRAALQGRYEKRLNDLSSYYRSDGTAFLASELNFHFAFLLFASPFVFAFLYAYDKFYCARVLAGAEKSGRPYLWAKIKICLFLASLLYWLPLLVNFLLNCTNGNLLQTLSLPYAFLRYRTALEMTIGGGLTLFAVCGFLQYLYFCLILLAISQHAANPINAVMEGLLYSAISWGGPAALRFFAGRSILARILQMIISLTPAGSLSVYAPTDVYFTQTNMLGLPLFPDYSLNVLSSSLLIIPVVFILFKHCRSCYLEPKHTAVNEAMGKLIKHMANKIEHVSDGK